MGACECCEVAQSRCLQRPGCVVDLPLLDRLTLLTAVYAASERQMRLHLLEQCRTAEWVAPKMTHSRHAASNMQCNNSALCAWFEMLGQIRSS